MSELATPAVAFNPFEPGFFADPYSQYAQLREHDPVHHSPLEVWALFRYEDVVPLLRDAAQSVQVDNAAPTLRMQMFAEQAPRSGREPGARSMLDLDPPDHTRLRRLVSKAFTPKMVEELRPRVQRLVDDALDGMATSDDVDLVRDLAFPLPFSVISEMLGMPSENRETVRGWSHTMTKTLDPVLSPEEIQAAMDASEQMLEFVNDVITWKREHPADDLLTALLAAEDEGDKLSEEELHDQVVLLYIAGHETTVNLIGNGMYALLRNRAQLERLLDDPGLDQNAIEELLRYDSPVQFSRRVTMHDVTIGATTIGPRNFVLTCLGSANRDPAKWGDRADELDLARPDAGQHMSFGNGIHHCLGSSLARTEGRVAITSLVRRFPRLELAGEPERNNRVVLRGFETLPITLGP